MNSSFVQHILMLRKNKWKLSNRDILTTDPCVQSPWHFPAKRLCHKRLLLRLLCFLRFYWTDSVRAWQKQTRNVLHAAYKRLHLAVMFRRRREAPLILQPEVCRPVKEGVHLRHVVQTGQGLQTVQKKKKRMLAGNYCTSNKAKTKRFI